MAAVLTTDEKRWTEFAERYKSLREEIEKVKPTAIAKREGRSIPTIYRVYNKVLKA